jgi:hypothetical protein
MKRLLIVMAVLVAAGMAGPAQANHPIDFLVGPGFDLAKQPTPENTVADSTESIHMNLALFYNTKNDAWAFGIKAATMTRDANRWTLGLASKAYLGDAVQLLGDEVKLFVGLDVGGVTVSTVPGEESFWNFTLVPVMGAEVDMGSWYFQVDGLSVYDVTSGDWGVAQAGVKVGFKLGPYRDDPNAETE